jgi:preprotein translocase subunit SecB
MVSAYVGDVAVEGIFRANPESEGNRLSDFLVLTNAASMLFGAVREMVLNLTSRGPWPAVMLTTVSFIEMASDIIGEQSTDVPREEPLVEPVFPWGARRH